MAACGLKKSGHLAPFAKILVVDRSKEESLDLAIQNILATAPEKFALAGLSQGGVLALEITTRAPERVQKLALLDTTPPPQPASISAARPGSAMT